MPEKKNALHPAAPQTYSSEFSRFSQLSWACLSHSKAAEVGTKRCGSNWTRRWADLERK